VEEEVGKAVEDVLGALLLDAQIVGQALSSEEQVLVEVALEILGIGEVEEVGEDLGGAAAVGQTEMGGHEEEDLAPAGIGGVGVKEGAPGGGVGLGGPLAGEVAGSEVFGEGEVKEAKEALACPGIEAALEEEAALLAKAW
jgi:hypothetical protein